MDNQDANIPATDTHLGPYAELTEEQKSLIAGTRLGFLVIASGHYDSREKALEDIVSTHNNVSHIDDIDCLFETHPGIFKSRTPVDVTTSQPVAVLRPLQLRR